MRWDFTIVFSDGGIQAFSMNIQCGSTLTDIIDEMAMHVEGEMYLNPEEIIGLEMHRA